MKVMAAFLFLLEAPTGPFLKPSARLPKQIMLNRDDGVSALIVVTTAARSQRSAGRGLSGDSVDRAGGTPRRRPCEAMEAKECDVDTGRGAKDLEDKMAAASIGGGIGVADLELARMRRGIGEMLSAAGRDGVAAQGRLPGPRR